ncbi:helix-turn-helix domain-containing protein [Streptosporangium lutulentum]|uniref:Transcriptional regulator with XRE-family HTH domain n=1 Tax=Streptosporangium lutulentum TaxID=1461250 RepID=A0ABT9Q8G7_9ACTN|nr:XRE family transcriptional regulator [Streptosporangium lutulentum]MDP9843016.1 transcriptional regulator with XRE-family HTH domain [Streptosporangium lutulentum]
MEVEFGKHIREERKRKGLSLRELAGRVGVSASMLSQVETGRSRVSVTTLYALVRELDLSLDELFGGRSVPDPPARPQVVPVHRDRPVEHAGDRTKIRLDSGVVWERLAHIHPDVATLMEITYPPGGTSVEAGKFQRHDGIDFAYVIAGRLTLHLGFDTYVLGPGDTATFDATEPHMLENTGTEDARALMFVFKPDRH